MIGAGVEQNVGGGFLSRSPQVIDENEIDVQGGTMFPLPRGWINIMGLGQLLSLVQWSVHRQCWVPTFNQRVGHFPLFFSRGPSSSGFPGNLQGHSHAIVNGYGCAWAAKVTAAGSGYNPANPPVLGSSRSGTLVLRPYVGGALTMGVVSGGSYDFAPKVSFDVSGQIPPFRVPRIALQLTSGAISGFVYDGDDYATGLGSNTGPSGAGLNVAALTTAKAPNGYILTRDPRDTQANDAVLSVSAAGAGTITGIEVVNMGKPIGNNDFVSSTTITHNGGSGLTFGINLLGMVVGATTANAGNWGTQTDTLRWDCTGGINIDEAFIPSPGAGNVPLSSGTLGTPALNQAGIGFGQKPFIRIFPATNLAPPTTCGQLSPTMGSGDDYFRYQVLA